MRTAALGAVALAAGLVVVLLAAGWRPVVLLSGSMAPAAPAGALLVARPVPAHDVALGDVVTVSVAPAGRVTHRVVELDRDGGTTSAVLRGDANPEPDPVAVRLPDPTLRTVAVVPHLGRLVAAGPLLLAGLGILLVGLAGLVAIPARGPRPASPGPAAPLPAPADDLDPRVLALLATLEAHLADGLPRPVVAAMARVRVAPLLGAGDVETAPEVAGLDDGARFVLVALVDADAAALHVVPPGSRRVVAACTAVAAWWERVGGRLPAAVHHELDTVLAAAVR